MTFDNRCFEKLHKTEAWMYTNVSALAKIDFALSTTFVDEKIIRVVAGVHNVFEPCRRALHESLH